MAQVQNEFSYERASKIPPAFSGMLVDWSIGPKEVASTIIDLVVRDYLGISGSTIFLTGKGSGLKKFEKKFIQALFLEDKSISFRLVQQIAFKNKLKELNSIICKGFIEEGLIRPDFQKEMAKYVKDAMVETIGYVPLVPKGARVVILPQWILRPIVGLFGFGLVEEIGKKAREKAGVNSYEDFLLTALGKKAKKDSLMLFDFMKEFPMVEDRLANELVSHAISFGIGKSWIKKLGGSCASLAILVETVEGSEDYITKFMDMDLYLKDFQE